MGAGGAGRGLGQLIDALRFHDASAELRAACAENFLDAVEVLSYRISALGLEPELLRSRPELEDHESPFIMQNVELRAFLAGDVDQAGDVRQVLVMLDQCRKVVAKVRS